MYLGSFYASDVIVLFIACYLLGLGSRLFNLHPSHCKRIATSNTVSVQCIQVANRMYPRPA